MVFVQFLCKVEFLNVAEKHLPLVWTSPNAIDPVQTFLAFLASVSTGLRHLGVVVSSAWTLAASWTRGPRNPTQPTERHH